jgi:hypothetical protein
MSKPKVQIKCKFQISNVRPFDIEAVVIHLTLGFWNLAFPALIDRAKEGDLGRLFIIL